MIVAERTFAESNGLTPLATLVGFGVGAVEPDFFGLGPVPAVRQALERAGWKVEQVERVEINEAFAAVALACLREIGFAEDVVNVEGGAIARGPIRSAPAARYLPRGCCIRCSATDSSTASSRSASAAARESRWPWR